MSSEPPPKPIGPGNHERAWNDPPLFSVAVNTTSKAPTRKLTGRVGFSFNSTTAPNTSQSVLMGNASPPGQVASSGHPPPPQFGPPPTGPTNAPQILPPANTLNPTLISADNNSPQLGITLPS